MKKKNKKQLEILRDLLTIIPMIIVLAIISRCLPDGDYRLVKESLVGEKAIALTFNGGPSDYTEALLDGLRENGAKASFFVTGEKAEENPEIVKRAYKEGHLIGNGTYDNIRMPLHSLEECEESLGKTFNILENITGERTDFVRAPYGDVSAYQLKRLGVIFVGWSVSAYDWRDKDADYIYNRIMKKADDGDIILLHDTKKETVEAVLRAIPELQEQGYEFVRVDELISRNGEKIKKGTPYRSCKYKWNTVSY